MAIDSKSVVTAEATTRELTVPADEGQLSRVRDFVAEVCEEAEFSQRETNNTKLAVDEACTNIIKHAYERGTGDIGLRAEIKPGNVDFYIRDTGKRFDFAGVKDPDLDQYVETGKKGGLGVFLINRLMDRVEYQAGDGGNQLFMTKQSRAATARMPGHISWRGSLRYKFTLRASVGFFVLIAAIWGYIFFRQTTTLDQQITTQWLEKRRLAESLSNRSKELLLRPQTYSIEQTTLAAFIRQMLDGNPDVAYAKVVDPSGTILSSENIDEIFNAYSTPDGELLLQDDDGVRWTALDVAGDPVRDISVPVRVRNPDTGQVRTVGSVHLGVYESVIMRGIHDQRPFTTLIILAIFIVGIFLIVGLVRVFVRPIQALTDGVRAIGQGSLDGKISIEGPAEIGAIASVFNEISEKFKKAQASVLEQEKLQREIEVAKQIQQALLPKEHPDVSGYDIAPYYQAAKDVGGDYYDFVVVDEETLGVVVADVSGKGVPGSLVMTMIRTALRMEARGNKNASDVMAKMNDFVTDDMKKGMFVTMFYVILDSKNRIISYASAGHNPMILFRAASQDIFFLNPKGFPVGISLPDETLFRRSISLEKIKLKKDDMLLIYTDGVTEAMNERREQYGEERLIEITKQNGHLHPTKFIDLLEKDIKRFTGGTAQNDDITVVAVKEKLAADDVLFGIRKKLIDMVEVAGMSVKEACATMKVSPATYYRYKKRMALMGDRGLKNKVLREDQDLKRVSIEERKALIRIIREHPEYGAKRIADEYNDLKGTPRPMTEKMVYDELRRLNLNTKELRIDYLRRHRLLDEEPGAETKTSKEMVEELISEVAREAAALDEDAESEETPTETAGAPVEKPRVAVPKTSESHAGVRIDASEMGDGIVILKVDGHLDSVSSTALEKKLNDAVEQSKMRIVVDLADVSYISSGGWGVMVGRIGTVQERGGDVVVVGMTPEVQDVYELLGFSDVLTSFARLDESVAYLSLPVAERRARLAPPPVAREPEEETERANLAVDEAAGDAYASEWASLQIEATTVGANGDIAVISLSGIIDTISAEKLRGAIGRVITSGISKLVIDMAQVEYVSSGGWGTFTERLREVRRMGGDIKLFGMDPDVYYIFTMLGFNIVLSSFDILGEAIEDFSRSVADKPSRHPEQTATADTERDLDETATAFDDPAAGHPADELFDRSAVPSAAGPPERVEWSLTGDVMVGAVHGMIEASSVEEIDRAVMERLEKKPRVIIFDLGDVDYVSSTGWGIFAKYFEHVSGWGGKVVVCEMAPDLYEIFSCLEFHSFIPSYARRDEALRAHGQAAGDVATSDRGPGKRGAVETSGHTSDEATEDIFDLAEAEPVAPESARTPWPSEATETETPRDPWPDESPSQPARPAGDDRPAVRPREDDFADFEKTPSDIDVDDTARDANLDEDASLRELGWKAYGKQLAKRLGGKRGKGDDDEDRS